MKIQSLFIALLSATVMVSCGSKATHAGDAHEHEETLQFTVYDSQYELFAEATPFAQGEPSEILAHFSHLDSFKPLTTGAVKASLMIGANTVTQTLTEPVRAGIYKFELKPTTEGTGTLVFEITTTEGTSQLVVPNVTVYSDEHQAHEAAAKVAITSHDGITLTKEQSWKLDFATEESVEQPFGQVIKVTAQILPSQADQRVISAKTSGMVNFTNSNTVEGKAVKASQTLFWVDASAMAENNLEVRYQEAASEFARAKAELDRKSLLAKDKIVSEAELLKAQTEFTNAEAVYGSLKRNFPSGKQAVSSPISGFVQQVLVRNGEYAVAGQPIMVVSQNLNLWIKAELQPKYYPLLSTITSANIRVPGSNQIYSLSQLGGKVVSYGQSSDLDNPLIPVVFQVNNTVGLLSGSFVEMYIQTQTTNQAVTIASSSLIEDQGSFFVFVQLTPELFERRSVNIGSSDGLRTQITHGLAVGERVVSRGAMMVKLATATGTLDAHSGHAH